MEEVLRPTRTPPRALREDLVRRLGGTVGDGVGNSNDGITMRPRIQGSQPYSISFMSEALEMGSPRLANSMLQLFNLTEESKDDERCVLINPAPWRAPSEDGETPFVNCVMDKEDLGFGTKGFSIYVCLNDNHKAFALGALHTMRDGKTLYELSMSEVDEVDVHYTGALSANPHGNEFILYDDSHDTICIREGQARRELGLIIFGQRQLGDTLPLELIIPRVQRDGQIAQFRPKVLSEAMSQHYKSGNTTDLFVLKGTANLAEYGKVQLEFGEMPVEDTSGDLRSSSAVAGVVFEAFYSDDNRWTVRYRHPLSAYQAFSVAIALLHDPPTPMLLEDARAAQLSKAQHMDAQVSTAQHGGAKTRQRKDEIDDGVREYRQPYKPADLSNLWNMMS